MLILTSVINVNFVKYNTVPLLKNLINPGLSNNVWCYKFKLEPYFRNMHLKMILLWHIYMSTICNFKWFSMISSKNKTNRHDITEILLKVALSTITLTLYFWDFVTFYSHKFPLFRGWSGGGLFIDSSLQCFA